MLKLNEHALLVEAKAGKNLHLEHLEDSIFNDGLKGVRSALDFITSLRDMLSKSKAKVRITTKFDGAPAIFCGINPENGKFFVGTKSVFNIRNPKINYTEKDIDKNHSGSGLNEKLKLALKHLKKIGISGVVQGDLMFTQRDLSVQDVNGVKSITFQPNTITYAVPVNSDLARQIMNAQLGIIFHTVYTGKTMPDMKASFNVNVRNFRKSKSVWFRDADFVDATGVANLTEDEAKEINDLLRQAENVYRRITPYTINFIAVNDKIKNEIKAWNNAKIRAGQPVGDIRSHVVGLINSVNNKINQEILAAKRPLPSIDPRKPPKQRPRARFIRKKFIEKRGILNFYKSSINQLYVMYQLHDIIVKAKMIILRKLQRVESIGAFLRTSDGYKATTPEGFVAINTKGGAVKLVDRLEFSHANFTVDKNWSK